MREKRIIFSEALKCLRAAVGEKESAVKFGARFGIKDRAIISRYEAGTVVPRPILVLKLAALAYSTPGTDNLVLPLLRPLMDEFEISDAVAVRWLATWMNPKADGATLSRILKRAADLLKE